jgi:hypothetical protein
MLPPGSLPWKVVEGVVGVLCAGEAVAVVALELVLGRPGGVVAVAVGGTAAC